MTPRKRFARRLATASLALASLSTLSCKDQELETAGELGDPCTPDDSDPCVAGLVCEPRNDDASYICAGPIELRGMVIDALSEAPIEGARVLALDDTSAPVSDVAITDAEGRYALPIAIPRDADGNPATASTLTLQAGAIDHQLYPSGLQPAFPVSTADVIEAEDDPEVDDDDNLSFVENASTTIALIPLDPGERGGFTISGRVEGEDTGGTLVVAEGGAAAKHTVADASGEFVLFNVPTGAWSVQGYRGGLQIEPAAVTVTDADVGDVLLVVGEGGTATVSGSVNIVNAPGGSATSVVLIPKAVFIEVFEFGPVPYGLRAPGPGIAPNVGGAWTIAGVPAGTYEVIASLENDFLVRDPDTNIAGTQIVEITVGAGETLDVPDSFKITEALEVIGPGRDQPEEVTGTPSFEFADDSSEDRYEVVVHDALGNEIWRDDQIPGVSGSDTVVVPYAGPALTEGMYYRFQATSWREPGGGDPSPISRTEDLRGVFVYRGG
ncbi:hypothetical protein ACNOYE_10500 [Nannocystaceae bacterium ST9]